MGIISKWLAQGDRMGNVVCLIGSPHTGKTTILTHIFKSALELDLEVITTTKVFKPPKSMHIVNCASELLKAYAETDNNLLFAFDDAQADFDSTTIASTLGSKINQKLYIYIAKLQANMIFVAHYPEKIPKPVWDMGPLLVWATAPGIMLINGKKYEVPWPPAYNFPKGFIPSWEWDIDMKELNMRLSKVKGRNNSEVIRNNKKTILKFLGDNNGYRFSKKQEIQVLLKCLKPYIGKDVKLNQKLIAEAVGVAPGYITAIKHTL